MSEVTLQMLVNMVHDSRSYDSNLCSVDVKQCLGHLLSSETRRYLTGKGTLGIPSKKNMH